MPLLLIYLSFIALGLPDGIFGVAWPTMRGQFGLPIDAMGAAAVAGTLGYLSTSFASGALVARWDIRGLLCASCVLTGAALFADCWAPAWAWYVLFSFGLGVGAGGVDAGLNNHVAAHLEPRHMHWLHAFYGVGVTLGPLLMTWGLGRFGDWRPGYQAVGALQLILALWFAVVVYGKGTAASRRKAKAERKMDKKRATLRETLSFGPAWFGMLLFFAYAGAEFGLGFWSYSLLTEARGVTPTTAGLLAGSYYGMFTVGRILSGWAVQRVSGQRLLRWGLGIAVVGAVILWLNLGPAASLLGLTVTGFAIAPVFPSLVSGTEARVGKRHAANTIGMQMAAAGAGASVLPALLGILAQYVSLESVTAALALLFGALWLLSLVPEGRSR